MINPGDAWYPPEYKSNIYDYLKNLEKNRYTFHSRSPQFEYRWRLIKWLKKIFEKVDFCRLTLHLAVFLLDFFMDSHIIKPEKLTLIASICFVLAGKFEERDANVPRISEINSLLNSSYSKRDIIYLEKIILQHFKWRLTIPTALHFTDYFMEYSIAREDICQNCSNYNYVYSVLSTAVNELSDILLEDNSLIREPPSFVAASCILAVRKSYGLKPTWPNQLENVTKYSESELSDCALHILEFRDKHGKQRKRKLEQSPDQGYETEKGSPSSPKTRKQ